MPSGTGFHISKNFTQVYLKSLKPWPLIMSNSNLFTHFGTPMNVVTQFFTALARSLTSITVPWKLTFLCTNKSMVTTRAPISRGWPGNKHIIEEMFMWEHVLQVVHFLLNSMLINMDMRNYLFLKLYWQINIRCVWNFKYLCLIR